MRAPRTLVVGAVAASVLAGTLATASAAPTTSSAPSAAAASSAAKPSENAKLDKTATPRLRWFSCYGGAECAKVALPLDYDNPRGAKTNVAVLRTKATGKRLGTLFVNPGGPGGSATELAYFADLWASPTIRKNFDVVGVDPRGIGFSDTVQCLPVEEQDTTYAPLADAFPVGYTKQQRYMRSMKKIARACSTNKLATAMSTAEVARDMEMVRRALGEGKLSYIGFSYGTQLGTTYANMFPSNFRSIVIDGTINPRSWSGMPWNKSRPLDFRLGSGKGAWTAMRQILAECQKAGEDRCDFAAVGDTRKRFDELAAQLERKPLPVVDPYTGEKYSIDYPTMVGTLLSAMYSSDAPQFVDSLLTELDYLATEAQGGTAKTPAPTKASRKAFLAAVSKATGVPRRDFAYDSSLDAFLSVTCTDSQETTRLADYPRYDTQSETTAPHFGKVWLWSSSGCAGDAFTGQDEDAYVGPYDRYTPKGVLIVGNYWDPATAYTGAVETRKVLGRSRLVSSDSWGHTAYGVSACATKAVDTYLVTGASPLRDRTCPAESPAFPTREEEARVSARQVAETKKLPKAPAGQSFPEPTVVR
ncbi:alpha/beta fold hydrolase [Janibacter melonis]|uniref:alpha/beta hydrolase n=1 Tax=Janibacter melonis TaxID=262209 RepID=UPI00177CCF3C|nr:alpha/beta hydrolase [Janibacter melonis]